MTNEKLDIPKNLIEPVSKDIEEAVKDLQDEGDMELGLRRVDDLRKKMQVIPEFKDTPENRFATYIVWDAIGRTVAIFRAGDKEWRETNEEPLTDIRVALTDYLIRLNDYFKKGSYTEVVRASKDYLFKVMKATGQLTQPPA